MKPRELANLGVPRGEAMKVAGEACAAAAKAGLDKAAIRDADRRAGGRPRGVLPPIRISRRWRPPSRAQRPPGSFTSRGRSRRPGASGATDLDAAAVEQMRNACSLPVAVAGRSMPDAHVGYGLPIGGVLATDNAVIPYAVGVDIACRMKLTVLDLPVSALAGQRGPARERHRAGDALRRRRRSSGSRRDARGHGRGLDGHAGHRPASRTRPGASSAPAAAATTSSSSATLTLRPRRPGPRGRRVPRAALATAAAAAPAREVADHYSQLAHAPAPGAAQGTAAPGLARPGQRGGPGVLGGDGADGPLRRRQPRADPPAHRASTSARTRLLDIENHHNFAWKETPRRRAR